MSHSVRYLVSLLLVFIGSSFLGPRSTAQELAHVTVQGAVSNWPGFPDSVSQGAVIKLKVINLSILDQKARGKIILFLDGMPLRALYPVSRDTVGDTLGFQFLRTEESKGTWDVMQKFGRSAQRFKVSVGPEDGYPVSSTATLTFVFYKTAILNIVVVLLVALLVALLLLSAKSDILRDSGPQTSPSGRKSYSMGRCQMAWWFLVVFSSFVLVRLVTGELPAIPDSVLALLGIAGGTGLGAVAIDANKRSQATSKIASLRVQVAALLDQQSRLHGILIAQPAPTNPADIQAELVKAQSTLSQAQSDIDALLQSGRPFTSEGFLMDILSDADGISFHRFQILAWTALLGIIFLLSALRTLTLVDFDNSLLALMGISSGTYLGFKLPEK
ncbi:MAG: hypothetical protein HW389_3303 [Bacteroidetes bacterium]|nr:hypothetical protein [Bacteroidota bacterium]